ncbi:hypothetical protein EMIHUDRAFT_461722 [Emiliania huxleyi CCMP1516]|uniref:SMP-30/Gluconolactonase/LRE-like region domain-containing protein n=2 Tax=Emiliania huxleyi TaxID=2903 RepID=A0A0D3IDR6_EMIH1|nr:hypothetical protein EMIHUDRAFT_461722 [Emiliania huxleyi CCMP1516]EOD09401.1 hypothetical protein EMIHUDRAFT_461722 [Emiliania huxleyi CCMP1516]|eukprot:XP_005761830.1 hypothetical protein EMIHUDRAFT_461722 [Emiliania huxleyi CCMP1516]
MRFICCSAMPDVCEPTEQPVVFEATEATKCEFDELHTSVAVLLAECDEPLFHEAGVWIPSSSEWLVTSDRLQQNTLATNVKIIALHHPSGNVRRLRALEEAIEMGNGGTTDFKGGAFLCSQGLGSVSGSLWHIDKTLSVATRLGPEAGLTLNSPNDLVLHKSSGHLLFTDPAYGLESQGFRAAPFDTAKAVWAVPSHPQKCSDLAEWRRVDRRADEPNGVLLSPDEKTAYVSDVWSGKWARGKQLRHACPGGERSCVFAYDVVHDGQHGSAPSLANARKLIDLCDKKEVDTGAEGYPDGLKCDVRGNLYAGCGDGVRVYSPDGSYLGRIKVKGGVSNLCFGGHDGKTLLLLNKKRAFAVRMKVKGAIICDE